MVTYSTLISLAKSETDARAIMAEMEARTPPIEPNVVTYSTLMSKIETFSGTEYAIARWKLWKQFPNRVFGSLTQSLSSRMNASDVFKTCFEAAKTQGVKFPTTAFQQAISSYVAAGKLHDAFRIAVAFPHLPGAIKAMKAFPEEAAAFFREHFEEEPHHASYALAKLYEALGQSEQMSEWAQIALLQSLQPSSRLDDLNRMICGGAST